MAPGNPNYASLLARAREAAGLYFPGSALGHLFGYDDDHGSITMKIGEHLIPSAQFGLDANDVKRWAVTMAENSVSGVFGDVEIEELIARRQKVRCNCKRKRKGRVIHIRRNRGERLLVASICFHLPQSPSEPLTIQAIGRAAHDDITSAEVMAAVWSLKQYVHALAPATVPPATAPRSSRLLHCIPTNSHTPEVDEYLQAIGFLHTKSKYAARNTVPYRQESG